MSTLQKEAYLSNAEYSLISGREEIESILTLWSGYVPQGDTSSPAMGVWPGLQYHTCSPSSGASLENQAESSWL